ncbi:matrixin family metalloprotease [Methylomarinum vadi]|uniref:matrixin family metalloprotease n=1 Tax=Methylomarinum vadi TaxID=438855 RepID=UPI0006916BFB|nr:matrixin family metalloprotease [Methylomarinum vadi]
MINLTKLMTIGVIGMTSIRADAITLQLDYSYDNNHFFDTPLKRGVLNSAASYFESRISDRLGAIASTNSNRFTATFVNPSTGRTTELQDFDVAADTLVVFAGGRDLGGSSLGVGGPGGYSISGTQQYFDASISRGQGDGTIISVSGDTAYDFAPWGGSITFDTDSAWYFDSDIGTVENIGPQNDFFSVALHELSHLLGFGVSDSWYNQVTEGVFTGDNTNSVYGSDVPLSVGGAHWQDGTISLVDGIDQKAAMTPSIIRGSRKYFTDLDLAGLQDVGWQISAVPVPASAFSFLTAVFCLAGFRGNKAGERNVD